MIDDNMWRSWYEIDAAGARISSRYHAECFSGYALGCRILGTVCPKWVLQLRSLTHRSERGV